MHGGADGSGAPEGSKNGNYKHGRYTKEVAATRRWLRETTHMLRDLKTGRRAILSQTKKAAEHRALRPPGSKIDCLLNPPAPVAKA